MTAFDLSGILQAPVVPSSTGCSAWTNVQGPSSECKQYAIGNDIPRNPFLPYVSNNSIYRSNRTLIHRKRQHHNQFARHKSAWGIQRKRKYFVDAEVLELANKLYHEFMEEPRYHSYRNRKPKKNDDKWPDHAEWAFWKAIAMNPPCGREQEKFHPDGKKLGRNEVIANFIARETGEIRERKSVSSHIQVLKDYVGPRQELLSFLLSPAGLGKHNAQKLAVQAGNALDHSVSPEICRPSAEAILQSRQYVKAKGKENVKGKGSNVEMRNFELYIHDVTAEGHDAGYPPLHFYTRSHQDSQQEDLKFEDWDVCFQHYPNLANPSINLLGVKGFLAANASLSFPQGLIITAQQSLSVSMMLSGTYDKRRPIVQSKTTFFDNGKQEDAIYQEGSIQIGAGESQCVYHIPFCTQQWVHSLVRLGGSLSRAQTNVSHELEAGLTPTQHQQSRKMTKMGVANTLRNLTAIQEIFIRGRKSYKDAEILLVVHWTFDLAPDGQPGKTTWSKLVLPELNDVLNRGEMLGEDLDFTKLEEADELPLDIDPQLQSPTIDASQSESQTESQSQTQLMEPWYHVDASQSQSQSADSWCTSANASQVFKIEDEMLPPPPPMIIGNQIIYEDHSLGGHLSQTDVSYGTITPIDEFDFTTVDFDASKSQGCFSNDVLEQSWDHFEDVFDPSLVMPVPEGHPVYPTPPTALELERFPTFGLECPSQTEAGASYEIKVEQESQ